MCICVRVRSSESTRVCMSVWEHMQMGGLCVYVSVGCVCDHV